jgi:hypothetical protein
MTNFKHIGDPRAEGFRHSDLRNRTMSLLIFITGKQGSGKSHVAKQWASNQAKHIDVDRILIAGGMGIVDSAGRDPTDWNL